MLRKILGFTLVVYALALFTPADTLGWGCGSWSRSGSASFTGRYGNTYSRSWSGSGSGYRYGGWGGTTMAVTTGAADTMEEGSIRAWRTRPAFIIRSRTISEVTEWNS